jgi:putative transposase
MRRSRLTEGPILGILREHDAGQSATELCWKDGIGDQALYNWTAKYGGPKPSEVSRLKGLEDENRRLKKLLPEAVMDNSVLREPLRKN